MPLAKHVAGPVAGNPLAAGNPVGVDDKGLDDLDFGMEVQKIAGLFEWRHVELLSAAGGART